MRLIGMLDSPYVRRVAVALDLLGIGFEHESVSVFRDYERFAAINPVVKAPSLVTDEGVVEMAVRVLGADRLLFGCDMSMTASVGRLRAADLSAADREKILGANLEKLLRGRKA